MKYLQHAALLSVAALMFPALALARNKNEHTVNIPNPVVVAHKQLNPGTYKVEWKGTGPHVQVSFLQQGKVVTTAPGTLKTNDRQATEDDIITRKSASNKQMLEEIDFGHDKEAVIFRSGA
jgi:hypothetical protein